MDDQARRKASKFLSGTLRHDPRGLPMDGNGYVPVGPLVAEMASRGLVSGLDQLVGLVFGDDKGRFEFSPGSHDEEGLVLEGATIRACSGHSLDVDLELAPYEPTGPLFFGTVTVAAERIEREGLVHGHKVCTRLLEDEAAANEVAAKRGGSGPAVFRVDAERMAADGYAFRRASNGEILGPKVPVGYVERVKPSPAPGMNR